MKKLLSLLLGCYLAFSSCKEDSIKWSIVNAIKRKCPHSDTCVINIAEITDFKWDKLYLLDYGVDNIDTVLGFHYPYFEDVADRIIFVRNNQVVYHEDEFPYPDRPPVAKTNFHLGEEHFFVCTPGNAIFGIKKITTDKGDYYDLSPIKSK